MKLRPILVFALVALFATSALAQKNQKRTVIIKDGKVLTDTVEGFDHFDVFNFDDFAGRRAFLGVTLVDLTAELRQHYGAEKDAGVLVGSVEENGPAAKAGVRVGDIITAVDGQEITSTMQLRKALKDKKEGESVRLDVVRGRSRTTVVASVVERERPGLLRMSELEALRREPGQWRTRVATPDCAELQSKLRELETKMKELEKKLQK